MREPRFGAAAVVVGELIYIVGGANAGNWELDSIERLDSRTGFSEPFGRLKTGRIWPRAAVDGRTMYVLGGASSRRDAAGRMRQRADESVELVDLSTGQIARGPDLPEPRRSFGCVLLGGRIFVFGGVGQTETSVRQSRSTWILDLKTQRWSEGKPMATPRETEAAVVDGPLVVVAGGYNGVQALADVEVFDPGNGTWNRLPPLCRPTSAHSLARLGHQLYLFGHYDEPAQCLAYNLRTKQSEVIAAPFTGARHSAAVVVGDRLYVIGGRHDASAEALDLVQVFTRRKQPEGREE
jgi:hypothetical protein